MAHRIGGSSPPRHPKGVFMSDTEVKTPKTRTSGKSKKGRSSAKHNASGKYVRQARRTAKNKEKAWKKHLIKHPNDVGNKKILEEKLRTI